MIPITLELEAFLPFKQRHILHFSSAMQQDKMFLITGNTGAGKTSIFDAICFALYGVPSGSQRASDSLKSQFAGDDITCYVDFTFENKGKRYQIHRTPLQNKLRRNGNITPESATAVLTFENGESITSIQEVNRKIEEILGLNTEQFKKIVMLPQGEFRRFLSDTSNAKQEILRKIFSTEIYERFTERLKEEYQQVQQKMNFLFRQRLSLLSEIDCQEHELLSEELTSQSPDFQKIYQLTVAFAAQQEDAANECKQTLAHKNQMLYQLDLVSAKQQNQQLEKYFAAKTELQQLSEQAEQQRQKAALVAQLQQTEKILPHYQTFKQLERQQQEAAQLLEEYREKSLQLKQDAVHFEKVYQQIYQQNAALPEISLQILELEQIAAIFTQQKMLKQQSAQLQAQLQNTQNLQKRQQLNSQLLQLKEQFQQVQLTQKLLAQFQKQKSDTAEKLQLWQNGYEQFFASQAEFLAQNLKEGAPCPVCGSLEHPNPVKLRFSKESDQAVLTKKQLDQLSSNYEISRTHLQQFQQKLQRKLAELALPEYSDQTKLQLSNLSAEIRKQGSAVSEQLAGFPAPSRSEPLSEEVLQQEIDRLNGKLQLTAHQLNEVTEQIAHHQLSEMELSKTIQQKKSRIQQIRQQFEQISKQLQQALSLQEKNREAVFQLEQRLQTLKQDRFKKQQQYEHLLHSISLSEQEFLQLIAQTETLPALEQQLRQYETRFAAVGQVVSAYDSQLAGKQMIDLSKLEQRAAALRREIETDMAAYKTIVSSADRNRLTAERLNTLNLQLIQLEKAYGETAALYQIASGKNKDKISFERYVLGVYFDQVIESANLRLSEMTDSRYFLRRKETREKGNVSSGLELEIFDANSGKFRHVNTLSGGESFKAALCLALGLADVMTQNSGGIEINTIFIDEGFGTLDSSALDSAIDCLYALRQAGRYIGIISHVSELRERIPVKLVVTTDKDGSHCQFNHPEN